MGEHGAFNRRAATQRSGDPRIEELERRIVGLTNAFGAMAMRPPTATVSGPDLIGLPAASSRPASAADGDDGPMAGHNSPEERARFVRNHIRQRRMRSDFFAGDLFADPAWDMLLDLYAAHYEAQPVSVSSLCIAAAVPATTALRWIKTLSARGWIVRSRDDHDGRRVYVQLSDDARLKLDIYFDALQV